MDLEFDFSDAYRFAGKMAGAQGVVQREMVAGVNRLARQGEAFAKQAAPVRTGHLRRSITATPASFGGGAVTAKYGTATPYAKYVEFGRGPVHARAGGFLRFEIGGRVIFAKRVGPAAARPFMRPSVARLRPLVQVEGRAMLRRIMAALGVG